jgi:hypothetical protein
MTKRFIAFDPNAPFPQTPQFGLGVSSLNDDGTRTHRHIPPGLTSLEIDESLLVHGGTNDDSHSYQMVDATTVSPLRIRHVNVPKTQEELLYYLEKVTRDKIDHLGPKVLRRAQEGNRTAQSMIKTINDRSDGLEADILSGSVVNYDQINNPTPSW